MVGAKVVTQNDTHLDSTLFSHLSSISTKLKEYSHNLQDLATLIPQTTRSIGFSSQLIANWANKVRTGMNLSSHIIYRTALAHRTFNMMSAHPKDQMATRKPAITESSSDDRPHSSR